MSHKIHNVRFYNLEPKSVICFSFEPEGKKLALARLVLILILNFMLVSGFIIFYKLIDVKF